MKMMKKIQTENDNMTEEFTDTLKAVLTALITKVATESYKCGTVRQPNGYDFVNDLDTAMQVLDKAYETNVAKAKRPYLKKIDPSQTPCRINGVPVSVEEFQAIDKELEEYRKHVEQLIHDVFDL